MDAHQDSALIALRRCLFLVSAPMVFITFALPLRAEDLGASAFEIGALYSLFTAAVFVIRPLAGIGLDKLGRRPFFILATLFYASANLLYALSSGVVDLLVARGLQGAGFALLAITTETITADLTQQHQRSIAMGRNLASQTRGGMVGATIGFTLVGAMPLYAWVYSFWSFFAVSILAVLISSWVIPETNIKRQDKHLEKFTPPGTYGGVLVIIFAAAFAAALIQPFYLIYLRARFSLELYMLAVAFLPIGLAYAILPSLLGKITQHWRRPVAVATGLIIAAIFYAGVPLVDALPVVLAAIFMASMGMVLVDLTKSAWVGDLSSGGSRGRTFGLAALAAGGGAVMGPIAGGWIYDQFGAEYLFIAAAGVFSGAALFAIGSRTLTADVSAGH